MNETATRSKPAMGLLLAVLTICAVVVVVWGASALFGFYDALTTEPFAPVALFAPTVGALFTSFVGFYVFRGLLGAVRSLRGVPPRDNPVITWKAAIPFAVVTGLVFVFALITTVAALVRGHPLEPHRLTALVYGLPLVLSPVIIARQRRKRG